MSQRVAGILKRGARDMRTSSLGWGPPPKNQNASRPSIPHNHSAARRTSPFPRTRRGLTLIELIVVIIVLGLLAGLVAPQIFGRVSDAKTTAARTQLELLGTALDNYRLDNGSYPTTEQGLQALREKPPRGPAPLNWRGPYVRKEIPLDPWGRAYIYRNPGTRNAAGFDLMSLGADGKEGGSGEDADLSSG